MKKRTNYVVKCKKTFPGVIRKGQYICHDDNNSKKLDDAVIYYSIDDAEDNANYLVEQHVYDTILDCYYASDLQGTTKFNEYFECLPVNISLVGDKK